MHFIFISYVFQIWFLWSQSTRFFESISFDSKTIVKNFEMKVSFHENVRDKGSDIGSAHDSCIDNALKKWRINNY